MQSNLIFYIEDFCSNVLEFSSIFEKIRTKCYQNLTESIYKEKPIKGSKELLIDLKNCNIRVQNDIKHIRIFLKEDVKRKYIIETNINLRDLAETLDQLFLRYNKFIRKDIDLLKTNLQTLVNSVKDLSRLIVEYNNNHDIKIFEFSKSKEFLNKVVNLVFNVTKLEDISYEDFSKKYPEADQKFKRYLNTVLSNKIDDRYEYRWLQLLDQYLDTFD